MKIKVSAAELELILEALDSHAHWQLSDPHYRSSGEVLAPGSDEPENAKAIEKCRALLTRLEGAAS